MFYKAKWLRRTNDCVRGGDCRKTTLDYIRFLPLGDFFLDELFFFFLFCLLRFSFFFLFLTSSEEPKHCISEAVVLYFLQVRLESRKGFPGGLLVKNPPANAGDSGWIPGLGRSPGRGNGNLLLAWKNL